MNKQLLLAGIETCLEYGSRVNEEAFEVPGARTAPDSLAPAAGRDNVIMQVRGSLGWLVSTVLSEES